jgi:hypothetical protein
MAKKHGEPWIYQSDRGLLMFNPIEQLYVPILNLLGSKSKSAAEIESKLEVEFQLTDWEARARLANGHRAWENHVAWALSRLVRQKRITKVRTKVARDGSRRGVYRALDSVG